MRIIKSHQTGGLPSAWMACAWRLILSVELEPHVYYNFRSNLSSSPEPTPVDLVKLAYSPRLRGLDNRHIKYLIDTDQALPPIIVNRRSMEVIDGAHRLMAARRRGTPTIMVQFFEGTDAEAFLFAVHANAEQGLPLTREDRQAATRRIVATHPEWSDRMIADMVGISTKTVASIRSCSTDTGTQLNKRLGKDGKMRPLDSTAARLRATEILKLNPNSSLREVARAVGLSPATVRDVKARLRHDQLGPVDQTGQSAEKEILPAATVDVLLNRLRKDPSLTSTDDGRALLRFFAGTIDQRSARRLIQTVPAHQISAAAELANACANIWHEFSVNLANRKS
ncbi:ParB/RepB/Spo0J family partition protein [Nocardia rhizosphaerae]|uniref:ParB N-terminal domain-containing protein n=1 Tax=Nocardia rhizosphaerae TaxID=1691571 RepID=A0ABV8L6N1_9NOCA